MTDCHDTEVLLADRQALMRAGLQLVVVEAGASVCRQTDTWAETLLAVARHRDVDVIILGTFPHLELADAIAELRELAPTARIICLVDWQPGMHVLGLFEAGADVVGDRRAAATELRDALGELRSGQQRVCAFLLAAMLMEQTSALELTTFEERILTLIASGSSPDEIGADLTVDGAEVYRALAGLGRKLVG